MATRTAGEVPIRVDNPNIDSGQKQLQRKEEEATFIQQITLPISFQEPNLLLSTICVSRRATKRLFE